MRAAGNWLTAALLLLAMSMVAGCGRNCKVCVDKTGAGLFTCTSCNDGYDFQNGSCYEDYTKYYVIAAVGGGGGVLAIIGLVACCVYAHDAAKYEMFMEKANAEVKAYDKKNVVPLHQSDKTTGYAIFSEDSMRVLLYQQRTMTDDPIEYDQTFPRSQITYYSENSTNTVVVCGLPLHTKEAADRARIEAELARLTGGNLPAGVVAIVVTVPDESEL